MYVKQIIMLYTLNLYSVVCQLYLNKTGRKQQEREKGLQGQGDLSLVEGRVGF